MPSLASFWWTIAAAVASIILSALSFIILLKSSKVAREHSGKVKEIFDQWSSGQVSSQNLMPKAEELALAIKNNCESIMLGAALYLAGGLLLGLLFESNFFAYFSVFYFVCLCFWSYLQKARIKSLKKVLAGEDD